MRGSLSLIMGQYGSSQAVLNRKMSYFERCDEEKIFALNGASQAFPVLRSVFSGARALLPVPTFGEYNRMWPSAATYPDDGSIDWDALEVAADSAELVAVVNPNNPTGTTLPSADVVKLAASHPGKVFVVDESFIDFSGQPSVVRELEREPLDNVVVLKSLSKCWGVPGLRLGYVYTSRRAVLEALWAQTPIWNMNALAEHFLEVILKHRDALAGSFEKVAADRADFAKMLEGLPGVERVFPSGGNFLLVRLCLTEKEAAGLADALMARCSFHVKDLSSRFGDGRGYFRLAVRLPKENQALCEALAELASDVGLAGALLGTSTGTTSAVRSAPAAGAA
jgi:histidinol-phosphate/aromatic aminotransferase/cobyric acid decarboxylase-like protein